MFNAQSLNGHLGPQWKPGFGDIFNVPLGSMSKCSFLFCFNSVSR